MFDQYLVNRVVSIEWHVTISNVNQRIVNLLGYYDCEQYCAYHVLISAIDFQRCSLISLNIFVFQNLCKLHFSLCIYFLIFFLLFQIWFILNEHLNCIRQNRNSLEFFIFFSWMFEYLFVTRSNCSANICWMARILVQCTHSTHIARYTSFVLFVNETDVRLETSEQKKKTWFKHVENYYECFFFNLDVVIQHWKIVHFWSVSGSISNVILSMCQK